LANPKIQGFSTNIGYGQLMNMDLRAFDKIFPEEITSVDEFIKNKNKNIRGVEADSVDGEIHQREKTHQRGGEANHHEEKPLVEVKRNKTKTQGVKMKKALIEEKEVEIYSKQLDSLA